MTITRRFLPLTVLLTLAIVALSVPNAPACQQQIPPQVQATCHVTPGAECIQAGDSVTVSVTVSNIADSIAPYQSDHVFSVFVSAHDMEFLAGDPVDPWGIDDDDGDGHLNFGDNCPELANEPQRDSDGDGIGDGCDNCPLTSNVPQLDGDGDGIGDLCDLDGDADGDGVPDVVDNCPTLANAGNADADSDDVGDACDNCPDVPNSRQEAHDRDGLGDACDNCPLRINPDQADDDGNGSGNRCSAESCSDGLITSVALAMPPSDTILLDDAADPEADDPSSGELNFTVEPEGESDGVLIRVEVRDAFGRTICLAEACVLICADVISTPRVALVDSQQFSESGGSADFDVIVERNGYPSGRPLSVQLIRENHVDPEDLFPIDPPELLTQGFFMTGESGRFRFTCGVHGPCYPGIANVYHAVVRDAWTGQTLRDTRVDCPDGLGRITVEEAPLAAQSLLEILDEGESSYFSACEDGFLRVRFQTRNAWHDASLEDVVMEAQFPPQLTVVDWTLHVHDNPMDAYDPTPDELDHFGFVTELPGLLRVETPEVVERFYPGAPPQVPTFRDMMELDVLFEVPAGGLGEIGELVFGGVEVHATRLGVPKRGQAPPLVLPVGPNAPPEEISLAEFGEPLRMTSDGRITWDDEPTLGADRHGLFRGDIVEMWSDFAVTTCERAVIARPTEWPSDDEVSRLPDPFPDRGGWFYLVRGSNCAGDGVLGLGSEGTPRPTGAGCP